ncbi:MAG: hypothetical protein JW716_01155 [Candidatus Aenigmarchaeota archaeon]|nr:hypothetical protein [Candidatus Aenigmarchaeota archaeon]
MKRTFYESVMAGLTERALSSRPYPSICSSAGFLLERSLSDLETVRKNKVVFKPHDYAKIISDICGSIAYYHNVMKKCEKLNN